MAKNQNKTLENVLSNTEGVGAELELESMQGSDNGDGDLTGHGDTGPTILKMSKE